jgi:hypothetical protein
MSIDLDGADKNIYSICFECFPQFFIRCSELHDELACDHPGNYYDED